MLRLEFSDRFTLRAFAVLAVCDLALIIATAMSDLGVPYSNRFPFDTLDLKLESNTAVWYSSLQLTVAAMLAFLVALRAETRKSIHFLAWAALAFGFLYLSIDETARLHERAGERFTAQVAAVPNFSSAPNTEVFGWVPALAPLIALFVGTVFVAVRGWNLPEILRARRFVLLGVVCWIGVIAAEIFQSYQRRHGMDRGLQGVTEEGLEVMGATFFVIGMADFHARFRSNRFSSGTVPSRLESREIDGAIPEDGSRLSRP